MTRDLLDASGEPSFGRARARVLNGEPRHRVGVPARGADRDHARRGGALRRALRQLAARDAASVARADCRLRIVRRHGVGYDSVDVRGATRAGHRRDQYAGRGAAPGGRGHAHVDLRARRQAVQRSTASARRPLERAHRTTWAGPDRTHAGPRRRRRHRAGAAGMARPFGWSCSRPTLMPMPQRLGDLGAERGAARQLLRESDFVVACCLLNDATRHLINAERARADEADRLLHQRGARADRRRAGADRGAASRPHRRRRPRRVRAGAGRARTIRCSAWTTSSSRRTRCAGPTSASTRSRATASGPSSISPTVARRNRWSGEQRCLI